MNRIGGNSTNHLSKTQCRLRNIWEERIELRNLDVGREEAVQDSFGSKLKVIEKNDGFIRNYIPLYPCLGRRGQKPYPVRRHIPV